MIQLRRERAWEFDGTMRYFCSIDTGGTFTDYVVINAHGRMTMAKSASTPDDFARGFFNALEVAAEGLG
jgi:N-methylhydantoinase A